jgi:hypothetical protein
MPEHKVIKLYVDLHILMNYHNKDPLFKSHYNTSGLWLSLKITITKVFIEVMKGPADILLIYLWIVTAHMIKTIENE